MSYKVEGENEKKAVSCQLSALSGVAGKYQPYPEYKESGVEWLCEVPECWKVAPCRSVVQNEVIKNINAKNQNYLSLMANVGVVKYEDKGDVGNKKPDDLSKCKIVSKGNLVINSMNYAIGSYGMSPFDGVCSPVYIVLSHIDKRIYGRFALRVFEIRSFQKYLASFGNGILEHRSAIGWDDIKGAYVPLPSIEEQRTIAAFLDYETARIDALIAKQQRLIELLKEKRQAVISHAVLPMEDDTSAKLNHFVDLLPGYAFPSNGFLHSSEGNIRLLRGTNVGVGQLKWDEVVYWSSNDRVNLKAFELEVGDIVFGMDRPWISSGARVAEVKESDLPCLLLQRVARIRVHSNAYQPFIKMCLSSNEFKAFVEADLTGVSVPHISPDQIKNFPIRAIGYHQQKKITDEANRRIRELEKVEMKATTAIRLLQERRTALISAAVTGKIDVRGWQPPAEAEHAYS